MLDARNSSRVTSRFIVDFIDSNRAGVGRNLNLRRKSAGDRGAASRLHLDGLRLASCSLSIYDEETDERYLSRYRGNCTL